METSAIPFQFPLKTTSSDEQNPISKQEQSPLLFHFPSQIFDDYSNHHQILFRNQNLIPASLYTEVDENPNQEMEKKVDPQIPCGKRRSLGIIPRRRAGKKDRHSKICTAQGIRDRRMRLSLQVARKFFDLQDMLGYDKASKTIEWLFTKSKKAIKELEESNSQANYSNSDAKSESFVSECEVMSGIEEISNKDLIPEEVEEEEEEKIFENPVFKPNLRESREKARARARRRTREKMMIKLSGQCPDENPNDHDQKLGFSSPGFETGDQDPNFSRISSYLIEDSGTIEKLLGIPASSSSYIDPNHTFMGLLQTWDL